MPAVMVSARARDANFFRGFALMARRDIFLSGMAHPRTPTPKVVPFGIHTNHDKQKKTVHQYLADGRKFSMVYFRRPNLTSMPNPPSPARASVDGSGTASTLIENRGVIFPVPLFQVDPSP